MTTDPTPEGGMPPTPSFRALCAELLEALLDEAHPDDTDAPSGELTGRLFPLVTRARAALAVEPRGIGSPRPIPVTERLPGADDMLDDECWWFLPANKYQGAAWILHPFDLYIPTRARHWLPAHALPLPGVEE